MAVAVHRALALLRLFSRARPEIGLSDAARLSGESKATVFRLLNTLCEHGFVEQNAANKTYRLGPAVLELARLREATVPLLSVVQPVLDRLQDLTGETCHVTRFNGQAMAVIASAESRKVHRITIQGVESLPLGTTAAGLIYLAFADPEISAGLFSSIWADASEAARFRQKIAEARERGYAQVETFEGEEVFGLAAPVFGGDQFAFAAIAVIVPPQRMTEAMHQAVVQGLLAASEEITAKIGGRFSAAFRAAAVKA